MKDSNCIDVYGYLKGETSTEESVHLQDCPSCAENLEETKALLSQLDSLGEVTPSSQVWSHLQESVSPRSKLWIPISVAAAILITLFVGLISSTSRTQQVVATMAEKRSLYIEEVFTPSDRTLLSLPGVGTLLVKAGSELRFTEPRKVILIRGAVFAEIDPTGKGFEIVSGQTRAVVQGTRFGVEAGKSVYVLEGKVDVVGPEGSVLLESGGVANMTPVSLSGGLSQIDLDWIQSSQLSIVLTREGNEIVSRGEKSSWRVTLSSPASVILEGLQRVHRPDHFLFLQVHSEQQSPYLVPIDLVQIQTSDGGPLHIGPGRDAVLAFQLDSRKFRMDGKYQVFAIYTGKGTGGGQATSNSVKIEVQR